RRLAARDLPGIEAHRHPRASHDLRIDPGPLEAHGGQGLLHRVLERGLTGEDVGAAILRVAGLDGGVGYDQKAVESLRAHFRRERVDCAGGGWDADGPNRSRPIELLGDALAHWRRRSVD